MNLDGNLTKRDALGISAMEGTGWMSVLTMGEKYLDYKVGRIGQIGQIGYICAFPSQNVSC